MPNGQALLPLRDAIEPAPPDSWEFIRLATLWAIVRRWQWVLIGVTLCVTIAGVVLTRFQRRIYQATASVLVVADSGKISIRPSLYDVDTVGAAKPFATQVEILKGFELQSQAFAALPEADRQRGFGAVDFLDANADLLGAIDVVGDADTNMITITVQAFHPEDAARYANSLADTLCATDLRDNRAATDAAIDFVKDRLNEQQRAFDATSAALAKFKQQTGLIAPGAQQEKLVDACMGVQEKLDGARGELAENARSLRVIHSQIEGQQAEIVSDRVLNENPRFSDQLRRLDDLYAERARIVQEFTPGSPEVAAINQQIATGEQRLRGIGQKIILSETQTRNPLRETAVKEYSDRLIMQAILETRIGALEADLARRQRDVARLPDDEQTLTRLLLRQELQKSTLASLTDQYQHLLVLEKGIFPAVMAQETAIPDDRPVSPRLGRGLMLSLVIGLLISALLIGLLELRDTRLRDTGMAERITGRRTLGVIPEVRGQAPILEPEGLDTPMAEQFRRLRNELLFSCGGMSRLALAVTSAKPGEGRTSCVLNLGIVLARAGKRVLLVDVAPQREGVAELLRAQPARAMAEVLDGRGVLADAVARTQYAHLHVLSPGPSMPLAEALLTESARAKVADLIATYDAVIFDCPAAERLSDIQVVASLVDGILVVVDVRQTTRGELAAACAAFHHLAVPVIGIVANRA